MVNLTTFSQNAQNNKRYADRDRKLGLLGLNPYKHLFDKDECHASEDSSRDLHFFSTKIPPREELYNINLLNPLLRYKLVCSFDMQCLIGVPL